MFVGKPEPGYLLSVAEELALTTHATQKKLER